MHGTLVLVVDVLLVELVLVDVVLVELVLVELVLVELVLVELVLVELVLVVERFAPGGPEWQWLVSPWPHPGLHAAVVEEVVVVWWGLPLALLAPEIAQAEAPDRTTAVATEAASLAARCDPSTLRSSRRATPL